MRDLVDELLQAKVKSQLFGGDHAPRLGRLVLLDRIGSGAMGTVFSAYDPRLDRKVAVKVVKSAGSAATALVLREARALGKLTHPNVVAVYDADAVEGAVYMVMELAPGVPLRAWIGGDRPWRSVVRVLREAASGIAAAHRAGLVHRDIKPDNILIGEDRARVVDFGLALDHAVDDDAPDAGTPAYMAPEVLGGADATPASDQFSFGVTLYEALYGARPHHGSSREQLAEAARRASQARPSRSPRGARSTEAAGARVLSPDQAGAAPTEALDAERSPAVDPAAASVEAAPGAAQRPATPRPRVVVPSWVHEITARALAAAPEHRFRSMDALVAALGRDRRRLRGIVVVAAALVAGATFGIAAYRRDATTDPCGGAEARIAQVWPHERSASLRATLGASPWVDKAVDALDDTATGWSASYRHVCAATRIAGSQSDSLLDLRMRCLDRALDRFGALTTSAAGPLDAAARAELAAAIAALPVASACETLVDPGELALPADPLRRARVVAAEHDLDRASVAYSLARYREARAEVAHIAQATRDLDSVGLRAQRLALAGSIEARIGDPAVARARLLEALQAAAAAHASDLELDVWSRLLRHALFSGDPASVIDDAPFALAAAARAGREGAEIDGIVGEALRDLGKLAAARTRLRDALASTDRLRGDQRAILEMNLGSVELAAGEPVAAEASFTRALGLARGALGEGHPSLALYLDKLAATDRARGRLRAALARHAESLAIRRAAFGPGDRAIASSLLQRARTFIEAGQLATATRDLTTAREVRVQVFGATSPRLAEIDVALGDAAFAAGEHTEARARYERAAALDPHLDLTTRSATTGATLPLAALPTSIEPYSVERAAAIAIRVARLPRDQAAQLAAALHTRWRAAPSEGDPALSLSVADALASAGDRASAAATAEAALGQIADEPSRLRLHAFEVLARTLDGGAAAEAAARATTLAAMMPELAR